LKTIFLSTGWALPTPARSGTSILLPECGVLIDCGGDAAQKILKTGYELTDVQDIYLTHGHTDHVSGLLGLIHANKFVDRENPLDIHGPKHALERAETLLDTFEIETRFPVETNPVEGKGETRGVEHVEADHSVPALSYRTEDVTFTGDTTPTPKLAEMAEGSRLLIAEATSPDLAKARKHGHMTPEDASALAYGVDAEQLAVIHTHPSMDDEELEERVDFRPLHLPRDLDTVEN